MVHVTEPAKDHGTPHGREAALEKLRTKSYLHLYHGHDRAKAAQSKAGPFLASRLSALPRSGPSLGELQREACARLARPLMHRHDYTDCEFYDA